MKCKKCGADNADGALTCASCGEPLAETVQEEKAEKADPAEEEKTAEAEKPAEEEKTAEAEKSAEEENSVEEEKPAGEEKPAVKLRSVLLALVLTLLGLAAVAAYTMASVSPPPLTDVQVLDGLPEGAAVLARHELENGRVQQVDYFYTDEHKYCLVDRTERVTFRYGDGAWTLEGEPEMLAEQEDWSGLAGYWTEQIGGRGALFLRLQVDGFGSGQLKGEILYLDGTSSCEGPAEELFSVGEKLDGSQTWFLTGTGFFRYNYLRVDRDTGVFFDNDITPMVQSDQPSRPPVAE